MQPSQQRDQPNEPPPKSILQGHQGQLSTKVEGES